MKKIIFIAGDKSGDLYGGNLCRILKEKYPSLELYSLGGKELAKYTHQYFNLVDKSVSGLIEVIRHIPDFFKLLYKTKEIITQLNPDLIIPIDFPDFNFRLIKSLKKQYQICYYISPQIWAWRKERIEIIKEFVDTMVVIFPFEKEFYAKEGVNAIYFGHPLCQLIPPLSSSSKKIISFMPGSRKNEIKYHLPLINQLFLKLKPSLPEHKFRIIRAENIPPQLLNLNKEIEIVPHSYSNIAESQFIFSACGTANIEIALLEVPFLVFYKLNPISFYLLKKIVKTPYISMVNIIAQEKIVEEYLQKEAAPEFLTAKALYYLKNPQAYSNFKNKLANFKKLLNQEKALDKFALYLGKTLNLS